MTHVSRRVAGLAAAPALCLSALAVLPAAPSYAAEPDPVPLTAGAEWIASELDGARFPGPFGFGQSIDAVIALVEAGGHATDVASVTQSVAADVDDYIDYSYEFPAGEFHTGSSGGAAAKSLVLATVAGVDPTDFGGRDLVAEVEGFTSTDAGIEGRVVGLADGEVDSSYTNTIIQALAVEGLDAVASPATDRATDYLVAQQCPGGYFREGPPAPGDGSQSCDVDTDPSVDATGQALLALASQSDDTDLAPVIEAAVTWLTAHQGADGSWGGNANATGLAGWALGELGETDAAGKAAAWIRAHQADDFGPCTTGLTAERGAIALDDAALATGRSEGITAEALTQFVIATTQALPALRWAPAGLYASEPTSTDGFVKAGSEQGVEADTLAPGQTVCFARGASQTLVNADATGHAQGTVVLPPGSGVRTYGVGLTDGEYGTITFRALAPKTFAVDRKKRVARGATQVVTVKGLASGESVKVVYRGKSHRGTANGKGRFTARFGAGPKAGKATFRVVGEFGTRKAVKAFTVVQG